MCRAVGRGRVKSLMAVVSESLVARSAWYNTAIAPGAQTSRPGDARPVSGLLSRYKLTGRFFVIQISRQDAMLAKSSILGRFAPWREVPLFLAVLTLWLHKS